jgi:hypothetical protein
MDAFGPHPRQRGAAKVAGSSGRFEGGNTAPGGRGWQGGRLLSHDPRCVEVPFHLHTVIGLTRPRCDRPVTHNGEGREGNRKLARPGGDHDSVEEGLFTGAVSRV